MDLLLPPLPISNPMLGLRNTDPHLHFLHPKLHITHSPTTLLLRPSRSHLFAASTRTSPPPPSPAVALLPPSLHGRSGTLTLSVADDYGTTVAGETRSSGSFTLQFENPPESGMGFIVTFGKFLQPAPVRKWTTIGDNLIVHGAGNLDFLLYYFYKISQKFKHDEQLTFEKVLRFTKAVVANPGMDFVEDGVKKSFLWQYTGVTHLVVRDRMLVRADDPNVLKMSVINSMNQKKPRRLTQQIIQENISLLGSGASPAMQMLDTYSKAILSPEYSNDKQTREDILSKTILWAALEDEFCGGFCELVRGTPSNPWELVSRASMEELRMLYGSPENAFPDTVD